MIALLIAMICGVATGEAASAHGGETEFIGEVGPFFVEVLDEVLPDGTILYTLTLRDLARDGRGRLSDTTLPIWGLNLVEEGAGFTGPGLPADRPNVGGIPDSAPVRADAPLSWDLGQGSGAIKPLKTT